ncbi:uncharacterized protein P884DRAFT_45270 [Thermothelomyces heterothallicus CBS 202.75]|uniref:uncharacterized protein n=1 Tax=Thermothelomyces heterothallicus CBS 202.75 TaxID=1149848 RepID=UPI0037422B7F
MRKGGDSPDYVVVRALRPPPLWDIIVKRQSKSQPDSASQVEIKTLHASLKRLVLQSKKPLCLGQRSRMPFVLLSEFVSPRPRPTLPPFSSHIRARLLFPHSASHTTKLSSHPVIYRERSRDTLLRHPNLPTHACTQTYRSYRSHSFIKRHDRALHAEPRPNPTVRPPIHP